MTNCVNATGSNIRTETIGISITKNRHGKWVHTSIKDNLKAFLAQNEGTYFYQRIVIVN